MKIKADNLYKIFDGKGQQEIKMLKNGMSKDDILEKTGATVGINNASFEVEEGEIFVIMGLSGSGKSTLLRCLNRLVEPTSGSVKIDGTDIMDLNKDELREFRKEKFGMVFQNFALFPYRTVLKNAEFGLEIQGMNKEKRKEKAMTALKQVGLEGYEEQKPDQLSGGMQQRVGLARALAVDTDVLLMDEPFSALDPLIKKDMQDKLLDLYEHIDKTIVFITHDLDEALKLGDRIAIMKDGEIVQIGNHEEILTNAENDYVAEFVQDVNRSRVLTAEDIMDKPTAVLYKQDGLRTALHKMRHNELGSIFVLGENLKYRGIVTIEDVVESLNNDKENLTEIIKKVPLAKPEESVNDLFSKIADIDTPLPVLDENKKLKGIIVKTHVVANLASEKV
ncbi:MAG: glycine betaine/proline transport system ATP-binding protein [Halanaerobium sp. 4-GBenrich]|uniref:Quaternary amine transport ATP-binding protein n=1 Tax=Halanaerobium congolense TaxID=54121 RepID=A0A1G6MCQ2_9FIRM|nr:MAG: glycine betaine/proline transport system ATP-binding protein [Halanaerobium sp. T82-1]ODS50509.1 MAG: glycine betaine/proline transport system ATP-binding protein [Halanaerobium sp. 4-GBenrich]PTX17247.1 glycine betaine/proline transport system ATP-binding protein [Halanaerobium congolense]PUU92166.1 MAG: glycine betaine/proline transport system ATP-binding protein [Halanaerobium sp.]PXV60982.1 glycine betaine/proline transport system ATP-binding protein [Halanaerobium congolense]